MFTPQRLFGEVESSPEILTHESFLERARIQREQERDASARLALAGYIVARLVDRLLLLRGNGDDDEGFRWQLEAVRRHLAQLPPDAPEASHLTGIVNTIPAAGRPTSGLWKSLSAYAYFLEHGGRLEEALEVLILAARIQGSQLSASDFATYALTAGRLNRQLARWEAARLCYSASEESALTIQDNVRALRGRLGQGAVDRGLGNLPRAREIAESVVRDASELELPEVQALAYADLGAVYALQGLPIEELQANYNAFRLTPDPIQRMRTLGDLGIGLYRLGALNGARVAFEIVIGSKTSFVVRINALLELMDLESYTGNRVAFERCRNTIDESRSNLSPSMATDYQYKLGMGLIRFGQAQRGRAALAEGLVLAEAHRLNAWYFKIEQALASLHGQSEPQTPDRHISDFSAAREIREVEQGLREYALESTY